MESEAEVATPWREATLHAEWFRRAPGRYVFVPLLAVVVIVEMYLIFLPFILSGGYAHGDRDDSLHANLRWPRTRFIDALHATAGLLPVFVLACWSRDSGFVLIVQLLFIHYFAALSLILLRDSIPGGISTELALPSGAAFEVRKNLLLGGCIDIHKIEIVRIDAAGARSKPAVFGTYMEFFRHLWIGETLDSSIVVISVRDRGRSRKATRPRMIEWVAHRVVFDAEGHATASPATSFATVSESDYCRLPRSTHEVSLIAEPGSGPWLLDARVLVEHLREMPSGRIYE